ncbi:MAG TPA: hypothetical protein VMZ04_01400, partial [Anaerolineae bacterium]|nr:hypothetical protein [Anaerolineae bacterium]
MRSSSVFNMTALIAFFCLAVPVWAANDYEQVIGLIHMDSEVSGGENSLAMLAAVAKNAGAGMALVTDHDTQKVTYGIWPLRNLLKFSYTRASVRTYGISKYLEEIEEIDRDLGDFSFLPGIEAVPYYYWHYSLIDDSPVLRNIHQHVLVMGLDKPNQIENLPSIETGYPSRITRSSLLKCMWFIPLIISFILFKPLHGGNSYYRGRISTLISHPINLVALPLMVVSIVFLLNSIPFKEPVVTQYGTDAGARPYQELIDYVNRQGGLVFWAHPEAFYHERIDLKEENPLISFLFHSVLKGGLEVSTDPYYRLLNETRDYTGFALFFAGYHIVGNPGGLWDSLLMQFCKGTRNRPVWAISEIDMEEGTDPETASTSQTVFLVREKTKEAYLEALRVGRMYCFTQNLTRWVTIRDYAVTAGGKRAVS